MWKPVRKLCKHLLPYVVDLMLEVADLNLNVPDLRSAEIRLTLTPDYTVISATPHAKSVTTRSRRFPPLSLSDLI